MRDEFQLIFSTESLVGLEILASAVNRTVVLVFDSISTERKWNCFYYQLKVVLIYFYNFWICCFLCFIQFMFAKQLFDVWTRAADLSTLCRSFNHYNIVNIVATHNKSLFFCKTLPTYSQLFVKPLISSICSSNNLELRDTTLWWTVKLTALAYTLQKNPTASNFAFFLIDFGVFLWISVPFPV